MIRYELSEAAAEKLETALVAPSDFIEGVRLETLVEDPTRAGVFRCSCLVALRRPLDLETAELRRLEVEAERTDSGWVIVDVHGLPAG